jgi:hypothetical protein
VKFDERLQELFKLRLKVNTAVTQEELKMARIKLWILTQSAFFASETNTRFFYNNPHFQNKNNLY